MPLDKSQVAALLPSTDPDTAAMYKIGSVSTLVSNILQLALDIAGLIAIIYILIGAFSYLTAYGSEEKATKGKTTIMWAIIGIVFIAVSKLIIAAVWSQVTGQALTFPI